VSKKKLVLNGDFVLLLKYVRGEKGAGEQLFSMAGFSYFYKAEIQYNYVR